VQRWAKVQLQKPKHMIKEELRKHWPVWNVPSAAQATCTA